MPVAEAGRVRLQAAPEPMAHKPRNAREKILVRIGSPFCAELLGAE